MTTSTPPGPPPAGDWRLDPPQLCRLAGVSEHWLHERITLGVVTVAADAPGGRAVFGAAELHRVRRLAVLERDFDAVPELAALVADLEDELARLRSQLRRWPSR